MHFLDARRARVRHVDVDVGVGQHLRDLAAVLAGHGDDAHFAFQCRLDGRQHVARVAGRGNRQQDVAGLAERLHLLAEDLVETVIVADGRDDRRVGGQRDARQRKALALEAADEFRREVLCVAGRAAVAAGEDLVAVGKRIEHQFNGLGNRLCEEVRRLQLEFGAFLEMGEDALSIHGQRL